VPLRQERLMVPWAALGGQVKGGDLSPLLSTGGAPSGVLCPVLGSSVQERHAHTAESPAKISYH